MMTQMGLTAFNGIANMFISQSERGVQKIMDRYNNTMAALSAAESNNSLTRNEIAIGDQAKMAEAADQSMAMMAKEAARVEAAAAGIAGNSVDSTLNAIDRGKAQRQAALAREQKTQMIGINDQRRQVAVNLAYGKAISVMPSTLPSQMLGLAGSLLDVYKTYQPETYDT
jgi:RNase P/RNase MRP subunit p29